ncbi:uncharacterized protein J8A68_004067 [[Candida] subhashii]|uniref:DUF1746 domain-containing protein n=1 Tax=[Candida] subhashii TaxID=561895 RepID=A0A8J5UXL7_9ASCO|nr:uncharacterized protein J8A68_004067 [[Candida] subhashii]KAG7662419.1 hypothetical protein J8A68_004067 [[Candida] subhashii]
MPGAFPTQFPENDISPSCSQQQQHQHPNGNIATTILEHDEIHRFSQSKFITTKTRYQHNILSQLTTIVYILSGYQAIKYCYSSAFLPLAMNVVCQLFLRVNMIEQSNDAFELLRNTLSSRLNEDELHHFYESKTRLFCRIIYTKTVINILYHIVFVGSWLFEIINLGILDELEHGSVWAISFIGESVPSVEPMDGYTTKVITLGLPQLIFIDLIVLFIELVQFQCIYKQSPIARQGHDTNQEEVFLVRREDERDSGGNVDDSVDISEEIPSVLKVRLFECFEPSGYLDDV